MKEPVDHVERPRLPWRADEPSLTECGLNAASVPMISRTELERRVKDRGYQRTALMTCMTCLNTAQRWLDWDSDPRQALAREAEWEGYGRWHGDKRGTRLRDELRSIAALISAHPDEFRRLCEQADWNNRLAKKAKAK